MALDNVPGVKIREVRLVGPPIAGVGTSTPAFVGWAPKLTNPRNPPLPAVNLVTSADQFFRDYINQVGSPDPDATQSTPLSLAVLGYFQNGGGPCYVVDVGQNTATATPTAVIAGIKLLEKNDQIQIIAAPGSTDATVYDALINQATLLTDRFAILNSPISDPNDNVGDLSTKISAGGKRPNQNSPWAAFYYPEIQVLPVLKGDPDLKTQKIWVASTGHIAGLYARVDALRGVHKAPANEMLLGAAAVRHVLTDAEQDVMNKDGVNAIRLFAQGPTVFGARTLLAHDAQDKSFLYINVRRLVTYVEQSLKVGLRFAIFEPNNLALRQQIARSVRGFLDGVWRDGALFGATADEAYYVRFPDAFNTDDDRALGKLTIEIGLRVNTAP